jgi:molybdopterin-guanine dinucleotide biosynthesis protein A
MATSRGRAPTCRMPSRDAPPAQVTELRRAGIVLAGGRSARFGRDKLSAMLGDRPLIAHAIHAVGSVTDVVIVAGPHRADPNAHSGDDQQRIEAAHWTTRPVRATSDGEPAGGPLVGLRAALAAAIQEGADEAVVVGGDMPWLRPAVLERMLVALDRDGTPPRRASGHPEAVVAVRAGSWRPLPIALRVPAAAIATDAHLSDGARDLFGMLRRLDLTILPEAEWRPLDAGGATFRDVDRPHDLVSSSRQP